MTVFAFSRTATSRTRLVVTNDRDIQFALSDRTKPAPQYSYASLSSDLYELVPSILVNEGAISSIEMNSEQIIIDLEGADLKYSFEPDAAATGPVELNSHNYKRAPRVLPHSAPLPPRSSLDGTLKVWPPPLPPRLQTASLPTLPSRQMSIRTKPTLMPQWRQRSLVSCVLPPACGFTPTKPTSPLLPTTTVGWCTATLTAPSSSPTAVWHQVAKEVDLQSTISSGFRSFLVKLQTPRCKPISTPKLQPALLLTPPKPTPALERTLL